MTLTGALRRSTGLMAAGALTVAVLAGCGSDSDSDTPPASGTSAPAPADTTAGSGSSYGSGASTAPEASDTAASDPVKQGTLTIDDFAFSPANPTFAVGQEVLVTNNDAVAHTWTSAEGGFDTGLIQPGQSATVTLAKAGTFDFVCTPHAAAMKGVVTVTG